MRASDADRDIVLRTLGEAYAEGRIDRDGVRRAGRRRARRARPSVSCPAMLDDLVPSTTLAAATPGSRSRPARVEEQAVARWEKAAREAFMGFLIPTVICWVVWAVIMFGGFPWPVFLTIGDRDPDGGDDRPEART